MSKRAKEAAAREAAQELAAELREVFEHERPAYALGHDVQVHCNVLAVARSGMSRRLDFYVMRNENAWRITHYIARLTGWTYDPDKGLRVDGAGMDMGFHTIHTARAIASRLGTPLLLDPQVRYL